MYFSSSETRDVHVCVHVCCVCVYVCVCQCNNGSDMFSFYCKENDIRSVRLMEAAFIVCMDDLYLRAWGTRLSHNMAMY